MCSVRRNTPRLLVEVCDIVPTVQGESLVFRVEIGFACESKRYNYGFELDRTGNVCAGSEYIKNSPGFQRHHELALKAAQELFVGRRTDLLGMMKRHCRNLRAVESTTSNWNWVFKVVELPEEISLVA